MIWILLKMMGHNSSKMILHARYRGILIMIYEMISGHNVSKMILYLGYKDK